MSNSSQNQRMCAPLLDKPQKRICRKVGPSFAASLEPLSHGQNIASLR